MSEPTKQEEKDTEQEVQTTTDSYEEFMRTIAFSYDDEDFDGLVDGVSHSDISDELRKELEAYVSSTKAHELEALAIEEMTGEEDYEYGQQHSYDPCCTYMDYLKPSELPLIACKLIKYCKDHDISVQSFIIVGHIIEIDEYCEGIISYTMETARYHLKCCLEKKNKTPEEIAASIRYLRDFDEEDLRVHIAFLEAAPSMPREELIEARIQRFFDHRTLEQQRYGGGVIPVHGYVYPPWVEQESRWTQVKPVDGQMVPFEK
jgi:hypothetical protein